MGRLNRKVISQGMKSKIENDKKEFENEVKQRKKEMKKSEPTKEALATGFFVTSVLNAIKTVITIVTILLAFIGFMSIMLPTSRDALLNIFS